MTSLRDVTRHLFKFGVRCNGVLVVYSVAAFKSAHGASDDTAAAADAVDVTSPSPTDVDDHDNDDAMTTAELKQAIVAMMKRKDDVDDDNRSVQLTVSTFELV